MVRPEKMYEEILRNDLSAFIHRAFLELNPSKQYYDGWHIDLLAAKLEEVRRGTCRRLIINIPPRHLKTHAVSVAFTAWLLGHDPAMQIISVTYGQDLSEDLARPSREIMRSPFYHSLFKTRLAPDREALADFATTKGGFRLSTSVQGALTGRGADVIIIDDPLKADDAQSDKRRRAVNDWFDNTVRSRLNNQETGAIIIVMQRLHADDLVAHVQQNEDWDVVSLPAIAEETTSYSFVTPFGLRVITREIGDVLMPALLSLPTLEARRRDIKEYNFAAQYQQNPQPASGLIVKRDWVKFYRPEDKPAVFDLVLQSWDTANKNTELSNYSACTTWGLRDGRLYLCEVYRRKLEFPELLRAVQEQARSHQAGVILIEDKASGSSLIQELHAQNFLTVQAAPQLGGDKVMRLRSQTGKIESGYVLFPQFAPWLDVYLSELFGFPNSKYDDQVDSTVFALAWLTDNPKSSGWTNEALIGSSRLLDEMWQGQRWFQQYGFWPS